MFVNGTEVLDREQTTGRSYSEIHQWDSLDREIHVTLLQANAATESGYILTREQSTATHVQVTRGSYLFLAPLYTPEGEETDYPWWFVRTYDDSLDGYRTPTDQELQDAWGEIPRWWRDGDRSAWRGLPWDTWTLDDEFYVRKDAKCQRATDLIYEATTGSVDPMTDRQRELLQDLDAGVAVAGIDLYGLITELYRIAFPYTDA